MDTEFLVKNSVGSIASGIFTMMILFFLVALPEQKIHKEVSPVLKGPRSYKLGVTDTIFKDIYPSYKSIKSKHNFHNIILEAANRYNIDPALIKAIIMAESGYNPKAISKKGAVGLMQIMPATATSLGVENLFDPVHNVDAGVRYFKRLLNQFEGNIQLAVAAYNAGSRKVKKYQGIPPFKATQQYVKKVFEYYQYYQGSNI